MSKRYLIIQTAFLGDTILSEPLVETIKENDSNAFVGIITTPANSEVFTLNPNVDTIITYDKHGADNGLFGFIKIVKKIKKFDFNCVISPHMSFRSSLLSFFSSAEIRIGFEESNISFLYNQKVKKPKKVHEIDKNLSLLAPLHFQNIKREIKLYYSNENKKFFESILEAHNIKSSDKIICISPSSIWPTKRWPKEYFKEVAEQLTKKGFTVLLLGTTKDTHIADFIKNGNKKIINLSGKTGLKDIFCIISNSNLLISNDSAPIHIASAYNIPTIDIFGPTVTDFGFTPLSDKHKIIELKDLPCRPCGKHGSVSCKLRHFKCMSDIKPKVVIDAAFELL